MSNPELVLDETKAIDYCNDILKIKPEDTKSTDVLLELKAALTYIVDALKNMSLEIQEEKSLPEEKRILTRLLKHEQMNLSNVLKISIGITKSLENSEKDRSEINILDLKTNIIFAREFLDIYNKIQIEQGYVFIDLVDLLVGLQTDFSITDFQIEVEMGDGLEGRKNLIISLDSISNMTKFRFAVQELLRNALKYGFGAPKVHVFLREGKVYIDFANALKQESDTQAFSSNSGLALINEALGKTNVIHSIDGNQFKVSLGPFDSIGLFPSES